ncbi:MAG: energy-coupling factor transporter transmembrane protein EcfT [Lachnospiraceae bacterium]|nr:energy-coupling factor transporter transmembrane protein EcfT [Lachnospiraceae bacterium]
MIKDITIGQYYAVDSPIHRLDPRVKLVGTVLFIVSLFVAEGVFGYLAAAGALAFVIHMSRVPFRFMTRGLKSILIIMLISVSFNIFFTEGTPVADVLILRSMTWEGLEKAVYMAIRLIMLILGSTIMTLTTTPNALTDGLEKGLGFLKKLHVPVHELAMMMSIALRFIPILIEETDKIMKAQTARGADFESGGIIRRIKAMVPLLIPLFISAFRRAADLALAMEARCYHGDANRTKMKPLRYEHCDRGAYGCMAAYLVLILILKFVWKGWIAG